MRLFLVLWSTRHNHIHKAMAIRPAVLYIPYATSSKEQTGDIITFSQFEEDNLLSESRNGTESCDKFDEDLTLLPLISEAKMDEI